MIAEEVEKKIKGDTPTGYDSGSAGRYDGRHSNDEKSIPVEKPEVSEFKESCPPPGQMTLKGQGMPYESYMGTCKAIGYEESYNDEHEGLMRLVLGLVTYLVCKPTLILQGPRVDESTSFTQGKVSSISIGGSISSEGFLSSILLLVVIIVMVVFVVVVLVVVVIAIVGVVIVVVFGIVIVVGVPLVSVFLLVLSVFAIDAACAFRAEEMPSLISCRMAAKVMAGVSDVDVLLGGILSTQDNA
ncbi:hypothetical protein Tco_0970204 [Tanacetum coccineum]